VEGRNKEQYHNPLGFKYLSSALDDGVYPNTEKTDGRSLHARQHSTTCATPPALLFFSVLFFEINFHSLCLSWPQTCDHAASTSQGEAGIKGMSHCA
jgi:hypothetical protein